MGVRQAMSERKCMVPPGGEVRVETNAGARRCVAPMQSSGAGVSRCTPHGCAGNQGYQKTNRGRADRAVGSCRAHSVSNGAVRNMAGPRGQARGRSMSITTCLLVAVTAAASATSQEPRPLTPADALQAAIDAAAPGATLVLAE